MVAKYLNLALVCITVASANVYSAKDEKSDLLLRVRKRHEKVIELHTDFTQTRRIKFVLDDLHSEGRLSFRKPDQLRWEVKSPVPSLIILKGNQLARFAFEKGKWQKLPTPNVGGIVASLSDLLNWVQGDFSKADARFDITSLSIQSLRLTRKDNSFPFKAIDIAFEDAVAQRVTLVEPSDETVQLQFVHFNDHPQFSARHFDLEDPDA